MTATPFKHFSRISVNEQGDFSPLVFASEQDRDECWDQMLEHYKCQSTERNYTPVSVIPKPINGQRSRAYRQSGAHYTPVKIVKNQMGDKYRILFTSNLSHKESNLLVKECWGDKWTR